MCTTRMMIPIFHRSAIWPWWRSCPEDFMDSEENGLRQGYSVSILQLPNEILHDILSFVLADTGSPEDESPRKFLFVINDVCRLFRDIAATLPFWYEPDFDFLSLYSPLPGSPVHMLRKGYFWRLSSRILSWLKHYRVELIGSCMMQEFSELSFNVYRLFTTLLYR